MRTDVSVLDAHPVLPPAHLIAQRLRYCGNPAEIACSPLLIRPQPHHLDLRSSIMPRVWQPEYASDGWLLMMADQRLCVTTFCVVPQAVRKPRSHPPQTVKQRNIWMQQRIPIQLTTIA